MTKQLLNENLYQEMYRFENDYGVLITHHEPSFKEIATIRFNCKNNKWEISDMLDSIGYASDELMKKYAVEVASLPDF